MRLPALLRMNDLFFNGTPLCDVVWYLRDNRKMIEASVIPNLSLACSRA